ncbi:hypothetical protein [Candidatus Nasuia deltocephalinicola]|uniref:hypothetical protein n=1 Tax=Candidatus Nasuia deltocephalincola TaxID=1160784 RepID=UPI00216B41B7|nr:hypothetical protein [Candidatus Nasuia deltocephalinicola]
MLFFLETINILNFFFMNLNFNDKFSIFIILPSLKSKPPVTIILEFKFKLKKDKNIEKNKLKSIQLSNFLYLFGFMFIKMS